MSTIYIEPLVSIIITSYNHAPFIREAIQSCVDSDYKNLEIIVIDSASNDGTQNILKTIYDTRLKVIQLEKNLGTSYALNTGITAAKGEYIALLSSDDISLKNRVRIQVSSFIQNPNQGIVFGKPKIYHQRGFLSTKIHSFKLNRTFNTQNKTQELWLYDLFTKGNCLCASAAMISKKTIQTVGFFDCKLLRLQDYDYWVRTLIAGYNIQIIDLPLIKYRLHGNNLSYQKNCISNAELETVMNHYFKLNFSRIAAIFGLPKDINIFFIQHSEILVAIECLKSKKQIIQEIGVRALHKKFEDSQCLIEAQKQKLNLIDILQPYIIQTSGYHGTLYTIMSLLYNLIKNESQ